MNLISRVYISIFKDRTAIACIELFGRTKAISSWIRINLRWISTNKILIKFEIQNQWLRDLYFSKNKLPVACSHGSIILSLLNLHWNHGALVGPERVEQVAFFRRRSRSSWLNWFKKWYLGKIFSLSSRKPRPRNNICNIKCLVKMRMFQTRIKKKLADLRWNFGNKNIWPWSLWQPVQWESQNIEVDSGLHFPFNVNLKLSRHWHSPLVSFQKKLSSSEHSQLVWLTKTIPRLTAQWHFSFL